MGVDYEKKAFKVLQERHPEANPRFLTAVPLTTCRDGAEGDAQRFEKRPYRGGVVLELSFPKAVRDSLEHLSGALYLAEGSIELERNLKRVYVYQSLLEKVRID